MKLLMELEIVTYYQVKEHQVWLQDIQAGHQDQEDHRVSFLAQPL